MSSMRALMGAGVKSVQYGSISLTGLFTTAPATVSAVVVGKAVLQHLGVRSNATGIDQAGVTLELTNSTTVTAVRTGTGATAIVNFCLVEYY